MTKKRVVITGMGIVSCFGTDTKKFYDQLLLGQSGIGLIQGFPCEDWPTRIAGQVKEFDPSHYMDKKQERRVDPFIRYVMVSGKKSLENAGLTGSAFEALDPVRCGVLVGSGMGGMHNYSEGIETLITKGYRRLSPFFIPYIITNMGGALLAIDLGFQGPNYSISTACATANYCIHAGAEHIRKGDADLMLCGGAEAPILPIGLAGFVAIKALSTRNDTPETASRPWDKTRDGFVMGEGAGVLVLEELEHAKKRGAPILAEYLGGAVSCDAYHMTDPREDGEGVALCMQQALADARISKEKINYVNAHATSTPAGDLCEIMAIKKLFGPHAANIKINATKSMIGHCLGAAGALEAVATVFAIQTGKLHPTINLHDPEPLLEGLDIVLGQSIECPIEAAISNSFGFGGHNSAIILAPYRGS